MPRPMLKPQTQAQSKGESVLSATSRQSTSPKNQQMNKLVLDRLLRQPRSKAYMDAIRKLDAGGHVHNRQQVQDLIDAIRQEFPEIEFEGLLLGIVAICYLGVPYEVHTLDITGQIIEHYKCGHPLPGGLEKARSLAIRGGYEFIEVYVDCCRCVSESGAVAVVNC